MSSDCLAQALEYAERGWRVLPLSAKEPDTRLAPTGVKDATTSPETIRTWWRVNPGAGVGIATGHGLAVVDVDPRHDGDDSLHELEHEHGEINTLTARTGGGGWHFYFEVEEELRGRSGIMPGIDVKGAGGYVVAPPSPHPSGKTYEWVPDHPEAPQPLPGWLFELITARAHQNGPAPPLDDEIAEGVRNTTLTSLAGTMRRRGMTQGEIEAALQVVNEERCRPPLPHADVAAIAKSVCTYEPKKEQAQEEPVRLEVLSAKSVCELPDPPVDDQLLGPLAVRGQRLIIGGHTGEGKTTIALQLLRSILERKPFLEWEGSGGRALFLDCEQGLRTVKRRLREAGLHTSTALDYVRVPDGLSLDTDTQHVAEVERVLAAGRYDVVVIDPLYKLHTGDSNAEREAVDLMKRMDRWREKYNFALVLPIHCRKPIPGAKFSIHDLFGSSAYVRGAEVVLGLRRVGDGYAKLHYLKDRDGDLPIGAAWGLIFDRETGFTRDPTDGKREKTSDKLAALLEEEPGLTEDQLAQTLGVTVRTIRRAKKELREAAEDDAAEEDDRT